MANRVLLVDDEEVNLDLMEQLVTAEGYEVMRALDGETALEMVKTGKPDVIFLDIVMPQMNGLEVLRKIKTSPFSYAIPVVMVTAISGIEERVKSIQAGADDFISKPFDRIELAARLKSLMRLKSIHDRLESNYLTLKEMQKNRETLTQKIVSDFQTPMKVIKEAMEAVSKESSKLSPEAWSKIEPALFCIDMAITMANDFVRVMSMEQDQLKKAYESLVSQQHLTQDDS
jgi:DNA-binding response OmpR family regulator